MPFWAVRGCGLHPTPGDLDRPKGGRARPSWALRTGDTNQNEKSLLCFRSTTEPLGLATFETQRDLA